eukprot:5550580-Amphidinium_carterae.1
MESNGWLGHSYYHGQPVGQYNLERKNERNLYLCQWLAEHGKVVMSTMLPYLIGPISQAANKGVSQTWSVEEREFL